MLMATMVLTGVRPQSKVECLLGSGPKVKSQATVLWRQTRGLRFERGSERGRRNDEERKCVEQVGRRDGKVSAPFVFVLCYEQAAYLIDEG